jgi:hypothetical protein
MMGKERTGEDSRHKRDHSPLRFIGLSITIHEMLMRALHKTILILKFVDMVTASTTLTFICPIMIVYQF